MQFRILGPLEVRHEGAPVRIAGAKQTAALALLLLEAGKTVPLHRFVDALWDDEPPGSARRQVQNTLAALRRRLAALGRDPIERSGESYRIAADDLDWHHFTREVAEAGAHWDAGRAEPARELLAGALDRWHGPALAGLDGVLIASATTRLDEARLAATERLIEVELALGLRDTAIERARALLAEEPYRQRAAGRLMLALHQSGRTAEALETYVGLRARLDEELGLEPETALRELHLQILRGETPPPPSRSPRPPAPPVPAQLPADAVPFTGRDAELAALDALLDETGAALVTGAGGVGKTALVVHWGHLRRERFGDGQLYVNLRGYDLDRPVPPIEALHSMLRALGLPREGIPTDLADAAALYRSLLADRDLLVILDNARTAAQLRPLLPGGRRTVAIATGRHLLPGLTASHGVRTVDLDVLPLGRAVDLLASIVDDERLARDRASGRRIAELCGRHPLALRVAAANLAARPHDTAAAYASALAEDDRRLALLSVEDDPEAAVAAAFDRSFAALSDRARTFACRLGVLPGEDFAADLLTEVGGAEEPIERALAELVNGHLLEHHRPGRYRFHDLMRLYVDQRQKALLREQDRAQVVDRCIEWHHLHRRTEEFANVVDACRRWAGHPRIWRLTDALRPHVNGSESLAVLDELGRAALAVVEEHRDVEGMVRMHGFLGVVAGARTDFKTSESHTRAAVGLIGRLESGDESGTVRSMLAVSLMSQGREYEAEPLLREALAAAERTGHAHHRYNRAGNLGAVHRVLGRYAEAERDFAFARSADEETSHNYPVHLGLARVFHDTGRLAEAEETFVVALRKAVATGSRRKQAMAHLELGKLCLDLGELRRARRHLRSALDLAESIEDQWAVRNARCDLGWARSLEGDPRGGLGEVLAMIDEAESVGGMRTFTGALVVAAEVCIAAGDAPAAIAHADRACGIFAERRVPLWHGRGLEAAARGHLMIGEVDAARAKAKEALGLFTHIGVPDAPRVEELLAGLDGGTRGVPPPSLT
ncbi:AfsR/SARP family transcriptional regulator [Glycomyces arizonensis]|uniref:AfsR/SARP family transcriptional regulator n=1 Tax=Glycomyces arizonensis TaxID=256035 RepID=UPI00040E3218|nr:BTAD domain-containing putative transcriptional regulator [Glycomyces arizonensis]